MARTVAAVADTVGPMSSKGHVALIRGINVGGKNPVPMVELRAAFEACGFGNVSTYIQSGNVLFDADAKPSELEPQIESAMEDRFGVPLVVVVRTRRQLADVVDKGIPAALVMANTRSILRGLARWGGPPGEALARANQLLSPEVPPGIFVTCLYGLLDTHNGALHYANAGHNPPYLRGRQGAVELWATGMALGLVPGTGYEEHKTTIGRGELLLLYSDGLSEAHSVSGEMFGDQRIQNILNREHHSAQGLIDALLSDVASFTGRDWVQEDDVTLMVLRRLRESEASP